MKKKNLELLKDEFVSLYKQGYSLRQIGEKYNVSKASVRLQVIKECPLNQRGLTEEMKIKAKNLYLEGYKVNSVAKMIGSNFSTVKSYLSKEFGVVTEANKKYEDLRLNIINDYKNGLSATDISDKYGVSRQTAINYINESHVETRDYSETSRLYELKDDYFDDIDSKKAWIAGIIFAKGRLGIKLTTYYVDVNVHEKDINILNEVISELFIGEAPKLNRVDNNLAVRVVSKNIYTHLNELGVHNKIKTENHPISSILTETYKESFWGGFIFGGISITQRSLAVKGYATHIKEFAHYLDTLGIKYRRRFKTSIVIENKQEVKKILKHYDFIKHMIVDYVESLNDDEPSPWRAVVKTLKP